MAKEDEKGSDKEYEFEMPDFDEDAFIHKEMVSFRTTSILFVAGIVAALISWGIFEAMDGANSAWFIGLAIMAAVGYGLRYLYPALKVDIRHFGRREWFGTFFLLFFAWLAFFILFINPPISDHADPTVDVFASPSTQISGGDVSMDLFVADNFRIEEFTFEVTDGSGQVVADKTDLTQNPSFPDRHSLTLEFLPDGEYTFSASATDKKGNLNETSGTFLVDSQAVGVDLPADNSLDTGDEVFVTVQDMIPCTEAQLVEGGDCVLTVGLHLQGGDVITMEFDDDFNAWKATNVYEGWSQGSNTFDVVVQQQDRFHGIERIQGGAIEVGNFTIDVPDPEATKSIDAPQPPAQSPVTVRTPGFGLVAGVAVLVGAAVVARRRQE